MRVAQVMAGAPAGGAELFFERLTEALDRAGETVLPVIRRDSARATRLAARGVCAVQLRFGGPLDLLTGPRLRAVLRRFDPRVVVAWMSRAARFVPSGEWVLVGRLGGFYNLRNFCRCDHLAGNTRTIVDWITSQGWPPARVHHLPNFVPDMRTAPPASRASLGVPEAAPLILALGRLHRNKAFDVLIRSLPSLTEAHVVIAGEGPEREHLVSLAEELGIAARVHLIGWRQDTACLLAACDVLVCPSRHEPLGNVVIEAWSAQRPVVAAAAQGPKEIITAEQDGLLVPPDDPDALASVLGTVLRNPKMAAAMAAAGRARFEENFAEAPVLARWREFLAGVEKT